MPQATAMTHTEDLRRRVGDAIADALQRAATGAAGGDFATASTAAANLRQYAEHALTAVVRDALTAGLDWWALGEHLGLYPQAAYEQYRGAAEGLRTPAQQRPGLAVICTAGLLDAHDVDEAGIDLDDLGDDHSLIQDPTVMRLRAAAAISRWSTVVTHPDELGWLREALHHRDAIDDPDDELESL
jgi:hypothetical protein